MVLNTYNRSLEAKRSRFAVSFSKHFMKNAFLDHTDKESWFYDKFHVKKVDTE